MRISKRKYAITGASRGLGAALAILMADAVPSRHGNTMFCATF